jgi:hypothetical protein
LAAIITPWVDILTGRLKEGNCALSMTNNTTLEGWLKKTNFIENGEEPIQATIRQEVARHHVTNYLLGGIREYCQWLRGADNNIADALSQDNNRSDNKLTNILRTHCYSQLPQHLKIVPLPNEITSWLTSLLLWLPVKQQLEEEHSRTKLGRGNGTQSTATTSDSDTTPSSTGCQDSTRSKLWAHSPWLFAKGNFQEQLMLPWLTAQLEIPSTLWLRPSGTTEGTTPNKMWKITLHDFYGVS